MSRPTRARWGRSPEPYFRSLAPLLDRRRVARHLTCLSEHPANVLDLTARSGEVDRAVALFRQAADAARSDGGRRALRARADELSG